MPVVCPYCSAPFFKQNNLNRHLKNCCPVLKASLAMSDLRLGRSEERDGQGARKKSKSRDRGSDGVDEFDMQTAQKIFGNITTKVGYNFKGAFDNASPVVQALLLDEFSRERLTYLQEREEFEERQRRFQSIDTAFTQIQTPQPNITMTTTAATSNSAGGIFGMFNSQNFTTNTSANP
jgi:hypothetical protein